MFLSCFPPRRPISERVCLKSTRGAAVSFIRCSLVHFVWTKDVIQIKTDRDRYPEPVHFSSSDDQSLRFRALAAVSPSGSLTNRAPALGLANVARKGTRGPHVLSSIEALFALRGVPQLELLRSPAMSAIRSLSGVNRTYRGPGKIGANDPLFHDGRGVIHR
jgi:hypothetical protein